MVRALTESGRPWGAVYYAEWVRFPNRSLGCIFKGSGRLAAIGRRCYAERVRFCPACYADSLHLNSSYGPSQLKTLLDQFETRWFLEGIVFKPHALSVLLAEGVVGHESPLTIAGVELEGTRPVNVTDRSRRFEVLFEHVVAHQVIDESYTTWDDEEEHDSTDHAVQVLSKSRFLDHLHEFHGWLFETGGKGTRHFRVWTYDAVMEVAATREPVVRPWRDGP